MRTMASRERFLTSICGGVPDRFFRYEHGPWPTTRERWLREGLSPETPFAEAFAMDPLCRFGDLRSNAIARNESNAVSHRHL